MSEEPANVKLHAAALTLKDAAKALGISVDMLQKDIDAGAPTNADGTINIIHYAAWLNRVAKEESDGLS